MKIKRFLNSGGVIYICAFLVPFIMSQIFFFLCKIYPYGSSSILTSDMSLEFVNFYSYFINIFSSKNDFSYMMSKTLGGDFAGLAAFQLHDPLLFILFFFPGDKIAAGIELLFSLQISIAGLSASILLNNRYRRSWISLLFSTAYSFCAFFFGYLILTIYFGCLALLPLVLYFFLKSLDEPKAVIPYTLFTVLYIFINFHMGFMLVIFLTLLYISRIIEDGAYLGKLKQFVVSGIIILLIDSFFLIRIGLSLIGAKTTRGADYGIYRRFEMNQLFANLFSGSSRNDLKPLIYCSLAAVFFTLIYFMSGRFNIRQKLANAFLIVSVAVSMWINLFDTVWHGFNNPEGFYWRYAFFLSLIFVVLGYKGFASLFLDEETDGRKIIRLSAALGIIFLYMAWLAFNGNIYLDKERLIINSVFIIGIFSFSLLCCKVGRSMICGFFLLLLLSVVDMLYDSKVTYLSLNSDNGRLPKMAEFKEYYREISSAVDYVKSGDGGFYRLEKDFDRSVNDPAMFDYIGMSHDSSCEKDEIIDWLNNFGFCRVVYYTYYNGGSTSWVDAFFGIKYYISRFDGINKPYTHMDYSGKYHVFRNEYALPMAFAAPKGLAEFSLGEGNTFEKQNETVRFWNGSDDIYLQADSEVTLKGVAENEAGHYVRTGEDGRILYNIKITEEKPLYFYFAAPVRQGAELFVNGKSSGPYFSENHWNVLCAGIFKQGDEVKIELKITGDEIEVDEACFYYEDTEALAKWSDIARRCTDGIGEINEISSSHLTYNTSAAEDAKIIMTIPYDRAWKIKCDGKKLIPGKALDVLMSYDVPAGDHVIEMKYVPQGTVSGLLVSVMGMVLFVLEIIYIKRRCRI